MSARTGGIELDCVWNHLQIQNGERINWDPQVSQRAATNAGIFPPTDDILETFSRIYLDGLIDKDLFGGWNNRPYEDEICRQYCGDSTLINPFSLEQYYHNEPWSRVLAGKKVLVIHPFTRSIEGQYQSRQFLFRHPHILPDFHLCTDTMVQSIAGNQIEFVNWIVALESMCEQIYHRDFDIAIIGASGHRLPLTSFVEDLGKQAVDIGGATQILFGIKGHRWDSHPQIF